MARPPATGKSKTKPFTVAPGFSIGGFDGKRKNAGDTIHLTRDQAKYYMKLRAIEVDLPDFGDEDDDDADDAGSKPADSDPAEAGSGAQAQGSGDADSGAASDGDADEEAGEPAPRRGKARL